jgi:hypothetical protein
MKMESIANFLFYDDDDDDDDGIWITNHIKLNQKIPCNLPLKEKPKIPYCFISWA